MKKLLMLLVMAMLFSFGCNITTDDGSAEDGSAVDTPVSTVEADDSATDSATLASIFQGAKVVRADELPACEEKLKGQLFYLSDLAQFQYCDGAAYQMIDLTGAKGDKGDAGVAGVDGDKGDPGVAGPAGPEGVAGVDGSSCSVTDNGDGTKTISCTDGTVATVSDGADGASGGGYSIGGTVSGLGLGKGLNVGIRVGGNGFLSDYEYDYHYISADGIFNFPRKIAMGIDYNVSILIQPERQECSVTNISGTVSMDVTDIEISCLDTFYVGGTVVDLDTGENVELRLNGGQSTIVFANGDFSFTDPIADEYTVTVSTHPSNQTCLIVNGTGSIAADITNVEITCIENSLSVSGTVSGLDTGKSVFLRLTGGEYQSTSVSANGDFSFTNMIAPGTEYTVAVSAFPESQNCVVTNGTGTISSNVSDVAVSCSARYTDNGDGTIADARLNLTWKKCSEGQTDDATCSGTASTYQYCTVNNNSCNGLVDDGILDSGPLFDACDALNTSSYGGKTTWRVPTIDELRTLISGSSAPRIDTNVFPGTVSGYYWSASSVYSTNAWYVYFDDGYAYGYAKTSSYYVRCVSP